MITLTERKILYYLFGASKYTFEAERICDYTN